MPVCFRLYPVGSTEASKLAEVDNLLCQYVGVIPDEHKYYLGWYDAIGFRLAMGKTYEEIRTQFEGYVVEDTRKDDDAALYYTKLLGVLAWLEDHYVTDSWREVGRRND